MLVINENIELISMDVPGTCYRSSIVPQFGKAFLQQKGVECFSYFFVS